jgi:GTPase
MSVSLVGYTNAGKSTLFNALTKAQAYAADQLFATLDTTSRRVFLGDEIGQVVISDTVGFIRELPHQLVAAFRATLEETIHADLLLHVVDASSSVRLDQIDQVNEVLHEIGADTVRQVLVFNKIDAVPELAARKEAVERDEYGNISRVFLSARTGQGLDSLRAAIAEIAASEHLPDTGRALPEDQPAGYAREDVAATLIDGTRPPPRSGPGRDTSAQPVSPEGGAFGAK